MLAYVHWHNLKAFLWLLSMQSINIPSDFYRKCGIAYGLYVACIKEVTFKKYKACAIMSQMCILHKPMAAIEKTSA